MEREFKKININDFFNNEDEYVSPRYFIKILETVLDKDYSDILEEVFSTFINNEDINEYVKILKFRIKSIFEIIDLFNWNIINVISDEDKLLLSRYINDLDLDTIDGKIKVSDLERILNPLIYNIYLLNTVYKENNISTIYNKIGNLYLEETLQSKDLLSSDNGLIPYSKKQKDSLIHQKLKKYTNVINFIKDLK